MPTGLLMPSVHVWDLITIGDQTGEYAKPFQAFQAAVTALVQKNWQQAVIARTLRQYSGPGTPGAYWAQSGCRDRDLDKSIAAAQEFIAKSPAFHASQGYDRDAAHADAIASCLDALDRRVTLDASLPVEQRVLPTGKGALESRITLLALVEHARRHGVALPVADDGSITVVASARDVALLSGRGTREVINTLKSLRSNGGPLRLHQAGEARRSRAHTYWLPGPDDRMHVEGPEEKHPHPSGVSSVSGFLPPLLPLLRHAAWTTSLPHGSHPDAAPLADATARGYLVALLAANPDAPTTAATAARAMGLTERRVRQVLSGLGWEPSRDGEPGLSLIEVDEETRALTLVDVSEQALIDRLDRIAADRHLSDVPARREAQVASERRQNQAFWGISEGTGLDEPTPSEPEAAEHGPMALAPTETSTEADLLTLDLDLGPADHVVDLRDDVVREAAALARRLRGSPPTSGTAVA